MSNVTGSAYDQTHPLRLLTKKSPWQSDPGDQTGLPGQHRLQSFQPLRLQTLEEIVTPWQRSCKAWGLIATHFPQVNFAQEDGNLPWWEVAAKLFNHVEKNGFFEVNWRVLNTAWNIWRAVDETTGRPVDPNGNYLAMFLDCMPITFYGMETEIHQFPPLELLRTFLGREPKAVTAELLITTGLYDSYKVEDWSEADRQRAWERVHRIERNPHKYPGPVRWIPNMARWACGDTGNVILDTTYKRFEDGPWYEWHTLQAIKRAWQRAHPIVLQREPFLKWASEPGRLARLTRFLMQDTKGDHYEW